MRNLFRADSAASARSLGLAVLIGISFWSAGCTPRFNWREIRPEGQGFVVLMPERPASLSREISLDGLTVTMHMTGARIDRHLFAVGHVVVDAADPAVPTRALVAMRADLLRNIAAASAIERPVSLAVVDLSGRETGRQAALRVDARGQVGGQPVRMRALFAERGGRLWQAVAIEPEARTAEADTMLDSFRLTE
jgi:hypothetical protein